MAQNDTEKQPVERGAAEDNAGAPLTETEVAASRRPPSTGDGSATPGGSTTPAGDESGEERS
jgi:hypothetical protein